jgi:hypothetical protein
MIGDRGVDIPESGERRTVGKGSGHPDFPVKTLERRKKIYRS